jgi:hypothetical protein
MINAMYIQAPCKRSQKLGDKITALQQLVSPYGKVNHATDDLGLFTYIMPACPKKTTLF